MSIEGQCHFFTIYFLGLYVLCFTRPKYQVSVYRTIGPLVLQVGVTLYYKFLSIVTRQRHTVYPVTPNAGMFYQRGYKHLRRGNTQGKKTCNSRISIVPISNILNDTSNVTDSVFAIFQKRLEQLNLTFHNRFRIL